ncbi:hypothetical protein LGR54_02765 [Ancylobacter sp. Lp-2]|uniref:hypothetical protein n=1 Tax=Ancylobacter sp. Lp-2 TaxID=2881339 RepID=UPI001E4DCDB4|nr:hypothetical protein [Ancylobacter sp. Lp-2]MCB4767516.1 hypothetical protein [Ancylobacter sp. Lp-2]
MPPAFGPPGFEAPPFGPPAGVFGPPPFAPAPFGPPAPGPMPPRPAVDFTLRGRTLPDGGDVHIVHRQGRIRVDVAVATVATTLTGFIDLKARKLAVLSNLPGLGRVAVEMTLPPEYAAIDMPADSQYWGTDTVAGEPCDIWRGTDRTTSAPVEACITLDGLPLRSLTYTDAGKKVMFQATDISRAALSPEAVALPKGVKVKRLPSAIQGMVPSLTR